MNDFIKELQKKLETLMNTDVIVKEEKESVEISIKNPTVSKAITITYITSEDLKMLLGKTPRFYPNTEDGAEHLLEDLQKYKTGKLSLLDYVSVNNEESKQDRLIKTADLVDLDLSGLQNIFIKTGLLSSDELETLLTLGGTVRISFWDASKNCSYKYVNKTLIKE